MHALVEGEYRDVRRYGGKGPVAIVPNGIDLAEFDSEDDFDGVLARWPRLANRRVALFLSRVHPKKGLPVLLEALQDDELEVRQASALALGGIGDKTAVPGLIKAFNKPKGSWT